MKIKPNASPDEISSPFFDENKRFCSVFERYIASKNGKVKGNYNAFSYLVYGKISNTKSWDVMYKKSTFTTSGNLLLPTDQGLLVMAEWATKIKGHSNYQFKIRRRKIFDFIKLLFISSVSKLSFTNNYIFISKVKSPKFISEITDILRPLMISKEIYIAELKNEKLVIELRTKEHHFDILDQILDLKTL